ncbi:MAG: nuclear transport factor 2 family protein [Rubrivivax sp.]|nr:MAG: nuclear transport factor 2 family protein [Rubrivivax sp.]
MNTILQHAAPLPERPHFPPASTGPLASPDEHAAVLDALLRFAAGQDLGDAALFRSAFTPDATLDFTQPAARLGVELPAFDTLDGIAGAILPIVAKLDTTHTVSNARIHRTGHEQAQLFALVEAMHLPKAAAGDARSSLLLKNFYWCDAVRQQEVWKLRRVHIHNVWWQGQPDVLFGGRPD